MRTALIPPIDLLAWTSFTDYHLMLPQLLVSRRYEEFYAELCASEDDFVILDNGLAEGYISSTMEMVDFANCYRPDEVVIPDVMRDFHANIIHAQSFLTHWNRSVPQVSDTPGLMFVCQGRSTWEFIASGIWAMNEPSITTIGIPRHALDTCSNVRARQVIANELQSFSSFNKQIHFLGASPLWSVEPAYLASEKETIQRCVRGMDTSMPFNYTYHGRRIVDDRAQCARPADYFDQSSDHFDQDLLAENVYQLIDWCKG